MNITFAKAAGRLAGVLLCSLVAGCASKAWQADAALYRCENALEFRARFIDDTAVLDSARGRDVLLRDAGGVGDRQTVYSNPRMRAEFGLGTNGHEAVLHYPLQPLVLRCVQQ